ncbi:hypothetical protein BX600DRAFT_442591 [Xylariales sp. PMI_506]|nr:hypothetical protein BX600DRAFT_442591 [Xylariales sp. PMI_506]
MALETQVAGLVPGMRSGYADLFGPHSGTFVACNEPDPTHGRHQYPFRLELEAVPVPNNCVAIRILARRAELPKLNSVEELNIIIDGPKCYDNVAAIDWTQY